MFRNLNEDDGCFVNEALEIDEKEGDKKENKEDLSTIKIEIFRSKYDQQKLNEEMLYKKPSEKPIFATQYAKINPKAAKACCLGTFPILSWLSAYKKNDFIGDLISGCTVAIFHIPQGMGYALLGNLPPIIGIYMAFYPVLMYSIFGTSRHNSMGTFAVIAIMVGKTVNKFSTSPENMIIMNETLIDNATSIQQTTYTNVEVATLICFIVGVIQILMYVFRLGILSFLLSEHLVSGFTTGAAIHVFTSQIKDLLGIQLPKIQGEFKLIKTYIEIFNLLSDVNKTAMLLSAIAIIILVFNNEFLKPRIAKRTNIPIPIELIVVVGGTLLAKYMKMEENWSIIPVGDIPVGLPEATLPKFDLWKEVLVDSIAIAFVSYSVTVSMALIFGQKLSYEIDFNQELLAMGSGNLFGAFFACFPVSASLSRSLIQQAVGGKTQMTSLINCALMLLVLLWIGPFFEVLPRCILASVVVVALKGMLWQVKEFFKFKEKSKIDAFIWMITFLTVVIISIDMGLLAGVILSVFCIFCNGIQSNTNILGNIPNTDLFLDIERYEKATEIPFVKIFQYQGSINFATKASFKNQLCHKLGIDLLKELKNKVTTPSAKSNKKVFVSNLHFKHLILDFSALTSIDASSINMLTNLIKDFHMLDVRVSIAGCSCIIYEILIHNKFSLMETLYPTIQDAIHSQTL